MGLNVRRLRGLFILCATLLTAASVAIAGMIGWIGLIIRHMARFIVGPNCKVLLPMSFLVGGSFLLLVDNVARNLFTVEIPLGHPRVHRWRAVLLLPIAEEKEGTAMILEARGVCAGYRDVDIVHDVSFELESGEVLCLLGPNGVGKTTLFKLLLSFIPFSAGGLYVDGRAVDHRRRKETASLIGRRCTSRHSRSWSSMWWSWDPSREPMCSRGRDATRSTKPTSCWNCWA